MDVHNKKLSKGVLESALSISKIFSGGVVGFLCGGFNIPSLLGLLLWILSIVVIVAIFKFFLGLDDNLLKLAVLHGTFASFIAFVFIWAILLGPPT